MFLKNKKQLFIFSLILGLIIFSSAWLLISINFQQRYRHAVWQALEEKITGEVKSFGQETGIYIKDLSTGWVIAINEDKLFPSASIVKIPIMATLFSAYAKNNLDLNKALILHNAQKVSGSGIVKEYSSGSKFNIENLVELMITESDNTATNMLIDYIGMDELNTYFKKMGLTDTNIVRKMMDFKSRSAGKENFTTARDLAFLLEAFYRHKFINRDISDKCLDILKNQKVRDRIPRKLPSATVVANKTGLENGICHDAGIVFTPRGDFLIVVLTKHNFQYAKPAKRFIQRLALDVYQYKIS